MPLFGRPLFGRRSLFGSFFKGLVWSVALGLLVFLCTVALREEERPSAPSPTPPANWAADFPTRIDQVTAALAHLTWPLPTPGTEPQGAGGLRWTHRRYDLTLPAPQEPGAIEDLLEPVRTAAAGVTLHVAPQASGTLVQIGIDGLLTHTLSVHWLTRRPRVAIIIDDLGDDLLIARTLAGIHAPLTFAILPRRPFSKQVAELASMFQREVLLHLPMEAEGTDDLNATGSLRIDFDRGAVLRGIDDALAAVPHTAGVNNHMGSRFTADRERMQWVLERLKEKRLFFIDSRTTPRSVACEVAAAIALPCVARDVFLDDNDEESAIRTQIDTLLALARMHADVIGIGHARPATVAALQAAVPAFEAAQVDIVPASTVVADMFPQRR